MNDAEKRVLDEVPGVAEHPLTASAHIATAWSCRSGAGSEPESAAIYIVGDDTPLGCISKAGL